MHRQTKSWQEMSQQTILIMSENQRIWHKSNIVMVNKVLFSPFSLKTEYVSYQSYTNYNYYK